MSSLMGRTGSGATAVGLWLALAVGMGGIAYMVTAERYKDLATWLSFGVVAIASVSVAKNWRTGIVLFLVWCPCEDLVRKSLGNAMVIYFVKDFIIVFTYAAYFLENLRKPRNRLKSPIGAPLAIWIVWGVCEAFNPNIDHAGIAFLGLHMSFLYVPMIFLGYSFVQKEYQLKSLLLILTGLGVAVGAVGLLQLVLGLSFLSPASAPHLRLELIRYAGKEAVPRSTGPFVDAGRYAQYLYVLLYVALGSALFFRTSKETVNRKWVLLASWLGVVVIAAAGFESGQRALVLGWGVTVGALAILSFWRRLTKRQGIVGLRVPSYLAAGLLLFYFVQPERVSSAIKWYEQSFGRESREYEGRSTEVSRDLKAAFATEPLFGHGTGMSSLGVQYVLRQGDVERQGGVECGPAWLVWEMGIPGLIIYVWWSIALAIALALKVKTLKTQCYYWLGSSLCVFPVYVLLGWFWLGYQVYQNYTTQSLLFFLSGLVLKLPEVEAAELAQPQPALESTPLRANGLLHRPVVGSAWQR
jgi:uncharacterized membrane protein SirB2